ncbi:MAG: FHA domain-containing protein [Myxococcota bacterium]
MIICPVCETENKPQATHCEVCGERLTPAAPGEVLLPEENVFAQLSAEPVPVPAALDMPAPPSSPPPSEPPPGPISGSFVVDDGPPSQPVPALPKPAPIAELLEPEFEPEPPPLAVSEPDTAPPPLEPPKPPESKPTFRVHPPVATGPAPTMKASGIPDARLVVYQNRQPVHTHPIANDETLIGRYDPIGGSDPDFDMTEYDTESVTSRKHAYIYRQGGRFFIYPVSNAGTQVGSTLVDMGKKHELNDGDVIVLSMKIAMKFHRD